MNKITTSVQHIDSVLYFHGPERENCVNLELSTI